MTQLTGMDSAAVRQIGTQLTTLGQHLRDVITAVEQIVGSSSTHWRGQDARDFHDWWQSQHRPALTAAAESVAGLGQSAANNAAEQERASGMPSGSAAGAAGVAAAVVGTGVAQGAPSPGSTVAPSSAIATKTAAFVATWDGKYLDFDGVWHNQCYDVFSQYNHDVVGGPGIHAATTHGAKDIYNDYNTNGAAAHYDRIAASAGHPQVGDVVVWGEGKYGHVGVVSAVSDSGFTALEQNTDNRASETATGAVTHQVSHTYQSNGLLGYLRPKA